MSQSADEAHQYLGEAALRFDDVNRLWRQLKAENQMSLARSVFARLRSGQGLLDGLPFDRKIKVNDISTCLGTGLGPCLSFARSESIMGEYGSSAAFGVRVFD